MVSKFDWEYRVFQSCDPDELENLFKQGWILSGTTGTTFLLKRDSLVKRENDDLRQNNNHANPNSRIG